MFVDSTTKAGCKRGLPVTFVSQSTPVTSGGQPHSKVPVVKVSLKQMPPLRHGFGSQGSAINKL